MNEIVELLRQTMGLHSASIGSTLIERAICARMESCGVAKAVDYLRLVRESSAEWTALVESVVVSETWFFRDREPFRVLAGLVDREWLLTHPAGSVRLLSIPCSTGEEPYSMAMALLEAGIPEGRFQIDAIDISTAAISQAGRAEYGKNSFRGKDLSFRARHFQAKDKSWTPSARVKSCVRFQAGNILDGHCLTQPGAYDFIFCRNLLIYFDRPTQERVVRKLHGLLSSNGVLFTGSAEVPIVTRGGFVSAKLPLSFACRKAPAEKIPLPAPPPPRPVAFQAEATTRMISIAPPSAAPPPADLGQARQLADAGKFDEAEQICERYLRERGVCAEAYYLLGLVHDAAGSESEAGEFYRKALYLEPNHYETLLQWASLSEKNGDNAHARILNERAERIKKTEMN